MSFYNETDGADIHPTPVVGLLGVADPMPEDPPRLSRGTEGMEVWLLGPDATPNLAGSSVQRLLGEVGGEPTPPDLENGPELVDLAARLAQKAPVLHDISDGGAAVALAEICIASGLGASVEFANPFNEDPHRFLVVATPGSMDFQGARAHRIGAIGGTEIVINGSGIALSEATDLWRNALERSLAG